MCGLCRCVLPTRDRDVAHALKTATTPHAGLCSTTLYSVYSHSSATCTRQRLIALHQLDSVQITVGVTTDWGHAPQLYTVTLLPQSRHALGSNITCCSPSVRHLSSINAVLANIQSIDLLFSGCPDPDLLLLSLGL